MITRALTDVTSNDFQSLEAIKNGQELACGPAPNFSGSRSFPWSVRCLFFLSTYGRLTWSVCGVEDVNVNRDVDFTPRHTVLELLNHTLWRESVDVASSDNVESAGLVVPEIVVLVANRRPDAGVHGSVLDQTLLVSDMEERPVIDTTAAV